MFNYNTNLVAAFLKYLEHMKLKAFNHCVARIKGSKAAREGNS